MYSFLNNLIYIVLPRIREFKGISSHSFDGHGNYNLSINNLFVFPEIEYQYDLFHKNYGLDISIVTTAKTDLECRVLLSNFQLPFNLIKK
jgi:large subunit ribosomal protein L5